MARMFTYPPKAPGSDAVAVLSPSWGGPGAFPLPFELGLARLREEFGLRPVEYPTTRAAQASPQSGRRTCTRPSAIPRSRPYSPVLAGKDEIKVLRHLDPRSWPPTPSRFSAKATTPICTCSYGT